jgi:hypothetical protein
MKVIKLLQNVGFSHSGEKNSAHPEQEADETRAYLYNVNTATRGEASSPARPLWHGRSSSARVSMRLKEYEPWVAPRHDRSKL